MPLGLVISPSEGPEETISRVHELGLPTCFLSLDAYIGKFTPRSPTQFTACSTKYNVTATTVEVVGPPPLVWDFMQGPSTIGVVPRATRAARIDALKQASDFAKLLGVHQVQTHCGFIPENPADPLYKETVAAIREVAQHCANNGQRFLMETGQETPTTMSRAIRDVNRPTLASASTPPTCILYGKANPVDAVDILGPHVHAIHAKDGRGPPNPDQARRRSPHRHRPASTSRRSSQACTSRLHRRHHHRARNLTARNRSKMCARKSFTSNNARAGYVSGPA